MRVLLLNQYYAPDSAPTGQFLHDLARVLLARGHEVRVISSTGSYEGGGRYARRERLDGIDIQRLPALGLSRTGTAGKFADYLAFFFLAALRLTCVRPKPDLILSLTTPPYLGLLGKLCAKIHGAKHAHWLMDLYPDVLAAGGRMNPKRFYYHLLEFCSERQLDGASIVITLGPHMVQKARGYTFRDEQDSAAAPTRVTWVALWSDPALTPWPAGKPNPVRAERGWTNDTLVFMYSGNMGLGHRFDEFLGCADELGEKGPLWAFAGRGQRRKEIQDFARANPQARIQLLPYVPREQLQAHLCAADVHLISMERAWQGLFAPSKLQSVFAAGKPVIFVGERDNEIAEWVAESGGGWIVPEGEYNQLLEVVKEAGDPREREKRGRAARAFAEKTFSLKSNCDEIADLLEGKT